MKLVRQFCAMFLLTLVLALPAMAGDVQTPGRSSNNIKPVLNPTLVYVLESVAKVLVR